MNRKAVLNGICAACLIFASCGKPSDGENNMTQMDESQLLTVSLDESDALNLLDNCDGKRVRIIGKFGSGVDKLDSVGLHGDYGSVTLAGKSIDDLLSKPRGSDVTAIGVLTFRDSSLSPVPHAAGVFGRCYFLEIESVVRSK